MSNPLDEIAIKHGTDKSSRLHGYTEAYHAVLGELRDRKLAILEIGVLGGSSLRMWQEFFPYAEVFGIDKNPEACRHESERARIFIGDQSDRAFLEDVARETGPLDLIIDDGSHHPEHQILGFETLFPHLRDGGIYVIEDLQCSFHPRYGPNAGLGNPGNAIEYLKSLLDVIHADPEHGGALGDAITSHVRAIHVHPRIAFLFKGEPGTRPASDTGRDRRRPWRAPRASPLQRVWNALAFAVRRRTRRWRRRH
ncbi:MAG: class I SAM-dependent methyltransferase [Myxococcota bacterium]